jgi:hypothetical protein
VIGRMVMVAAAVMAMAVTLVVMVIVVVRVVSHRPPYVSPRQDAINAITSNDRLGPVSASPPPGDRSHARAGALAPNTCPEDRCANMGILSKRSSDLRKIRIIEA